MAPGGVVGGSVTGGGGVEARVAGCEVPPQALHIAERPKSKIVHNAVLGRRGIETALSVRGIGILHDLR